MYPTNNKHFGFISILAMGLLTACGGGGSSTPANDTTSVSGFVFAAAVQGATVTIDDCNGNQIGTVITTSSSGVYSVELPAEDITQNLCVSSAGGNFNDEATNVSTLAGRLSAYIEADGSGASRSVHLTPASTIIHDLILQHGKSRTEAENLFNNAFGYTSDITVAPDDATNPVSADEVRLRAGLRAAAFSQMAMDIGLTAAQQFALFEALASDLADGTLDGDASGAVPVPGTAQFLPLDISNRFSMAMLNFREGVNGNPGRDQSGLTNDQIGKLPFAMMALTDSYKVEYLPGMMNAMEGKSAFTLRVTDINTDAAVTGLNISLMPMMHMSAMMHSTPVANVVDNNDGSYSAKVYYLMPSSMMNGMSMGYWELKVMIGGMMGEKATFFPDVMMAMGDSVKGTLKGQNDLIAGMMMGMTENRNYYLFKESLTGMTGNHTFNLFIAAREDMMKYPAVDSTSTLSAGTAYELVVTTMSVEVSSDASTWVAATDNGNGQWSAAGITGLTNGSAGTLYVRLAVNGEQKTTDGLAPAGDGSNDYTMFTVTPGGM